MNAKCEGCPAADLACPCHAQRPGRSNYCRLIAKGREGYRELVRRKTLEPAAPPVPPPGLAPDADRERDAILARRAMKARLPLGQRVPAKRGGG